MVTCWSYLWREFEASADAMSLAWAVNGISYLPNVTHLWAGLVTSLLPGSVQGAGVSFKALRGLGLGYLQDNLFQVVSTCTIQSDWKSSQAKKYQLWDWEKEPFLSWHQPSGTSSLQRLGCPPHCGLLKGLEDLVLWSSLGSWVCERDHFLVMLRAFNTVCFISLFILYLYIQDLF